MSKRALAVVAHPDDTEFLIAGTLMLLKQAGYEIHYLNIANGSYGSTTMTREQTLRTRTAEAQAACEAMGATFHPPMVEDLAVYYTEPLVLKVLAAVRRANPEILLTLSPQDYMEDHINASRLAVTAAFCKNIPNYVSDPPVEVTTGDVVLYHAMPVTLTDQLCNPVLPELCVDISSIIQNKRRVLACHASQKQWLDETQGMDNYLDSMQELCAKMGKMSGKFEYAEGWHRHSHAGFAPEGSDPLRDALGDKALLLHSPGP